ncbi:MAG: hypothetical protein HW416_3662 [Chloroflexi bacterium]|nr:hypothetical protein [Chloroflexota bacterium]
MTGFPSHVATSTLSRTDKLLPILAGLGLFALTLVWSIASAAPISSSQPAPVSQPPECPQPSESGCILALDVAVASTLLDATVPHLWLLSVPSVGDLTVTMTYPSLLTTVAVTGPDGGFVGSATNSDDASAAVVATTPIGGTYSISVLSATGELDGAPYQLVATFIAAPADVPTGATTPPPAVVDPYRPPTGVAPTPFNPYRVP